MKRLYAAICMLSVTLSFIFVAGSCVVEETPTAASRYERGFRPIINGVLDTSQEHMGVVALYNSQGAMCTGTLISPKVILTAGHCIDGFSISNLSVIFGDNISTGDWVSVDTAQVHPDYYAGGGYDAPENDIALVRMTQNAPSGIAPIPYLPEAYGLTSSDVGNPLVFVGFGTTGGGGQNTRKYYFEGNLGLVCDGPNTCSYGGASVAPRTIAYSNQEGGPCSGDSGGPALVEIGGQEYVAGVTSYGDQNCTYFGVSTKVDKFQTFIEDFIGSTDPEDCINGTDDDGDGLVDCADPECAGESFCSGPAACEEPAGTLDCGQNITGTTSGGSQRFLDYSCFGEREVGPEIAYMLMAEVGSQVTVSMTPTAGIDLDLFLVPALTGTCDPDACTGSSTNGGTATEEITFTVDSGGTYILIDSYGTQGGSFSLTLDCDTSSEICDNSQDDDNDGKTDCADPDCASAISCQGMEEICDNQQDDDYDDLVDCDDPDCVSFFACQSTEQEICDNGRDDDGDGFRDCADPDCVSFAACQGAQEICNDGADNDSDGLIDCVDPDCRPDQACADIPPEDCQNGADDDGDTFIDCGDPDCRQAAHCSGRPTEVCFGAQDEDSDGLVDCADPDCFAHEDCRSDGGGKGGCECRAAGGRNLPPAGWTWLGLLALIGLIWVRRRGSSRAR
jgi:hypothetical protein